MYNKLNKSLRQIETNICQNYYFIFIIPLLLFCTSILFYIILYLKFQNVEFLGDRKICAFEYILPRKLPNQTSYP